MKEFHVLVVENKNFTSKKVITNRILGYSRPISFWMHGTKQKKLISNSLKRKTKARLISFSKNPSFNFEKK